MTADIISISRPDTNEQWLLDQLKAKVEWHVGSDWVMDSKRITVNILDALVARGLVEKRHLKRKVPVGRGKSAGFAQMLTDVYVLKGHVFARSTETLAHECTHLKHPDECCPGRGVCNHGVACGHGSCCNECYETRCPHGIADVEESAMRSLKFHQLAGSAPEWSPIVYGEDGGGGRDFLDGEPIHCGAGLELQAREETTVKNFDAEIEGYRRLATGVSVRYELKWFMGTRVAMLHLYVGGHEFEQKLDRRWMRFRWPGRKQ